MTLYFQRVAIAFTFVTALLCSHAHSQVSSAKLEDAKDICFHGFGAVAPQEIYDACNTVTAQLNLPTITYAQAYLELGMLMFGNAKTGEELEMTISALDAAIAHQTDSEMSNVFTGRAYFYRAQAYAEQGNTIKAIEDFSHALQLGAKKNSGWSEAQLYLLRADAYSLLGNFTRAIADYNEVLSRDQNSKDAYSARGRIYVQQGNAAKALADLNRALDIAGADPDVHHLRGIAYLMLGKPAKAVEDFDKALGGTAVSTKQNEVAFMRRGIAHLQMNNLDAALADLNEAIRRMPNLLEAYIYQSDIYSYKHDYDNALASITRAAQLAPKNIQVILKRADVQGAKGDDDKALADYNEVLRQNSKVAQAYFGRGLIYIGQGDFTRTEFSKALSDFDIALRLEPDYINALTMRCRTRAAMGEQLEQGLADCEKSLQLQPDSLPVVYSRALVQIKLGNYQQALTDIDWIKTKLNNDPRLLFLRGVVLNKLGREAEGQADIAKSRSLNPKHEQLYASIGITL